MIIRDMINKEEIFYSEKISKGFNAKRSFSVIDARNNGKCK